MITRKRWNMSRRLESQTQSGHDPEEPSPAAPCSPFPLPIAQFEQVLKETGLVDAAAIEDPHGFDNFATQAAIYQAWAKLHGIIEAND